MKDKAIRTDSQAMKQGNKAKRAHEGAKKYSRGSTSLYDPSASSGGRKSLALRALLSTTSDNIKEAVEKAAEVEVLLPGERGGIELEEDHLRTFKLKQKEIVSQVDVNTAQKAFDLHLTSFGPYHLNYSRNGRQLLFGGRRGHVATFDCHTMSVGMELQLQQEVFDVQYLHNESLFAVAQSKYVYIYDNQGVEIHCMKKHQHPLALEYLPYHFLLATVGQSGQVKWHDVSTGELVGAHNTSLGSCHIMRQNPANAVMHLGHSNGVVSLWSPTVGKSLASIFTHAAPLTDIAIDRQGMYMATAAMNGQMKVWDLRMLSPLHTYNLKAPAQCLDISETGLLALSMGRKVEVLQHAFTKFHENVTYMAHELSPPPRQAVRGTSGAASRQSLASNNNAVGTVERDDVNALRREQQEVMNKTTAEREKKEKQRKRGRNKISARLKRKQQNVIDEQVAKAKEAREKLEAQSRQHKEQAAQEAKSLGALARFKN
eukprot:scaffold1401_cov180-Ochromonas_danica.AAC.13